MTNPSIRFHTFFHHIDNYRTDNFLWVTATGIPAASKPLQKGEQAKQGTKEVEVDSEDEGDVGEEEG